VGIYAHGATADGLTDVHDGRPTDVAVRLAAVYDPIADATAYHSATAFERAVDCEFDAIVVGGRDHEVTTTENGTDHVAPGMPERVIGKAHVDADPDATGFVQYDVTDERTTVTRYDTDARPVVGFRIELAADATVTDVVDALPETLSDESAAVFELTGEATADSIPKRTVQGIVEEHAAVARGYDDRRDVTGTATDPPESLSPAPASGPEPSSESDSDSNSDPDSESEPDLDPESESDQKPEPDGKEGTPADTTVASITTTSSLLDENDVEETVEKLRSRGATRDEALAFVARYARGMDRGEGLYAIRGVGPITGYHLAAHDITTRAEFERSSLAELKAIDGISDHGAEQIWSEVETDRPADATVDTESVTDGDDPALSPRERESPSADRERGTDDGDAGSETRPNRQSTTPPSALSEY
jgi:predicted flap endonuclease-1-like 5' DNA nuclease